MGFLPDPIIKGDPSVQRNFDALAAASIGFDVLHNYDRDAKQAGMFAYTGPGAISNEAVTANQLRATRFVPSRKMVIIAIKFVVQTAAGSDDDYDVGIYNSSGTLLVSSGATAGKLNSTGVKSITTATTTLNAGSIYYCAGSCGAIGTTAAQLTIYSLNADSNNASIFSNTLGTQLIRLQNTAHPLPATLGGVGAGSAPMFVVAE